MKLKDPVMEGSVVIQLTSTGSVTKDLPRIPWPSEIIRSPSAQWKPRQWSPCIDSYDREVGIQKNKGPKLEGLGQSWYVF